MTKKEYILKMLDGLKDSRPMAAGLKLLVEKDVLAAGLIDRLTEIFKNAINTVTDKTQKEKLQKGADFLEKLKAVEAEQHEQEEKELQELDKMLANF